MRGPVRHGWGIEIPIKYEKFRDPYRVVQYNKGIRVISESDADIEATKRKENMDSSLANTLSFNGNDLSFVVNPTVIKYLVHKYYIEEKRLDERKNMVGMGAFADAFDDDYGDYGQEQEKEEIKIELPPTDWTKGI